MNNSIVAEKIRIILKFVGYTLGTGFVGSVLIAGLALQAQPPDYWRIGVWFVLSSLNFLVRYLAFVRTKALSPAERVSLSAKAWLHTFVSGCIWGAAVILFVPSLQPACQAAFAITLVGLNITSIPLMSDVRGISVLFLPAWLPMAAVLYLADGSTVLPIAIFFLLGCVYLVAFIIRTTLDDFIAVRLERDHALEDLGQANAMQMSLFLAASHDFRQPIQSISFYLMSIRKRLSEPATELHGIVDMIEERLDNLHHLIDETIGFAKLSMGLERPEPAIISAQELVDPLLANFKQHAESKGLSFRVYCSEGCSLSANRQILDRILDNLISNALRNTRRGGVLVAFRKKGNSCSVQVWDTGFGIPEYEHERIFDAFYQGERNAARKGHGLGLMIVKRLAERISADLTLSSRVDHGTVFRLKIPLATLPVTRQMARQVPRNEFGFDGRTVAVLDDDQNVRNSLSVYLTDCGARVICARDRQELLAALNDAPEPCLLVTDLHLEKELGDEIAMEMRARYPSMKIILLTADASDSTQSRLKAKGLTVLGKPVLPHILLDKIVHLLEPHGAMET
jgi:signal transduction histidine kinase/CheY-like chemotaxis protein